MRLLVLGLSITSSWGNGHATVYRGLLKELHRVGIDTAFIEKDVPWYSDNRDLPAANYARILLYRGEEELDSLLDSELPRTDAVLQGSYFPDGVRVADRLSRYPGLLRLFYDIDTPVTLRSFATEGRAPYLRADQIPLFDVVLSFTGGRALDELKSRWGARLALPFYCALDPQTHHRTDPSDLYSCRLSYMGTYSSDRHQAWEALFLRPARRLPEMQFVLAGPQYPPMQLPSNLRHFQHLAPVEHSALYSSSDLTLNLTRAPMVAYGYSPSVRLFEAAGCAAAVVSDEWQGLDEFFEIGREILVARSEQEMVGLLLGLGSDEAKEIGQRAHLRVLREHTYVVRARQLMELLKRGTPY